MKIYRMKDSNDSNKIEKKNICSLPMRSLMIGASGLGKSSLLGWLMCNSGEAGYKDNFNGDNIYIFSGSYKNGKGDEKLDNIIKFLDIPEENVFSEYDNDILNELYNNLVNNFNESKENNEKPKHSLIIFDDLGFTNQMNKTKEKDSVLDKIFCNGRKFLVSTIILVQRVIQVSPSIISQSNSIILFKPNNRDLDIYESNFNYLENSKIFKKMVRRNTEDRHQFMAIDLSKNKKEIYKNHEFENIKFCSCHGPSICGGLK